MLKNLKVGTKLIAILVAPVVVLVLLAAIGVRERLDVAQKADRVFDFAQLANADYRLATELEKEGIYSAQYMASNKAKGKAALDEQRTKTNAARAAFDEAAKNAEQRLELQDTEGNTEEEKRVKANRDLSQKIKAAQGRLQGLNTSRVSVDARQTDSINSVEQNFNAAKALYEVNSAIGNQIEEPSLARKFQTFKNMQKVISDRANEAMLHSAVAQVKAFPAQWGTGTDGSITPCDDTNCSVYEKIKQAFDDSDRDTKTYDDNALPEDKQLMRDQLAADKFDDLKSKIIKAGEAPGGLSQSFESALANCGAEDCADELVKSSVQQVDSLTEAETTLLVKVETAASDLQSQAKRAALLYVVGALGAIAIALIFAFFVARATTVPLKKLTSAAYSLSTDKLPALVERLRNPDESEGESLAETLTPIDIHSKDEIGQLADAFNSIQQVTIEVAEEQAALLRKGIGDIFINLARRNQTLLDRQIEFIDQLEANEEDPDQLDNLFKLDHLATRMRRNAESLLVLAGAEPPRRRGRPVALADVVRVAIGEVEDFARIQLLALDDATVGGNVAVDLAHLLSELMENATHFSPPDTMVEIVGHRSDDGSYIISVSDQGIGMSAEQLAEANVQLGRPPLVGLALSRSLGFIVIGRLAQRFEISVKLTASPSGGVTALVTLPTDIVTYEGEEPPAVMSQRALDEAVVSADEEAEIPQTFQDEAPSEDMIVLHDDDEVVVVDQGLEEGLAEDVDEDVDVLLDELIDEPEVDETPIEVPEAEEFERGLQSMVDEELPPGPVESDIPGTPPIEPETTFPTASVEVDQVTEEVLPPVQSIADQPGVTVAEQVTAAARAEAKAAELTAAGLVRRTPKKKSADAEWTPPNAEAAPVKSTGQTHRSPEEVRKMLSRYRSGLNRGKSGPTPEKSEP